MGGIEHKKGAPQHLRIAVLTVSDSRAAAMQEGKDEDVSGKLIERRLKEAGHAPTRLILPDEADEIRAAVERFSSDPEIDAIITTGGTGITARDVTIETICPLLEKELPGFGELLRRTGYEKVGGPAILTRATAGVIKRKPIFCLPGAPNAVEVAMELILPELGHIVKHARE
ncbi:MAG: MogA/MoaB family molybdenum cofactor biosynthesis protein [Candidatus Hodarchaeaceae archaeon]|nr:MogA/MoaB family molybdenum cofactor biosynthesis protein [Candidatus Hodarchaeaceae archaeon]